MGAQARSQVRQARQSFALRDPELALDLTRQDDTLDRLNREIFRRAIDVGGDDADLREWAMSMILVARALERDRRQRRRHRRADGVRRHRACFASSARTAPRLRRRG